MLHVGVAVIDAVARDPARPAFHQSGRRVGRSNAPIAERVAPDHLDDGEPNLFDKSGAGRVVALPVERRRQAGGQPGGSDEELGLLGRRDRRGHKGIGDDQKALLARAVAIDLPAAVLHEPLRRPDHDALDAGVFDRRPIDIP